MKINNFKKAILIVCVGVSLHVATFYVGILLWVVFAPLVYVAYRYKFEQIIWPAVLCSAVTGILTFYWVWGFGFWKCLAAIIYCFVFVLGFILLMHFLFKIVKSSLAIFVAPFSWMFLMFVFSFMILGEHSFNVAINQAMLAPIISIVGGYGLTALIFLFNSLLAFYFIHPEGDQPRAERNKNKKMFLLILVLVFVLILSYAYSALSKPEGESLKVALIQGNFDREWKWRVHNSSGKILDYYISLSREAAAEEAELIVWPEYAIPHRLVKGNDVYERISDLAQELKVTLVLGSIKTPRYEIEPEDCLRNRTFVFGSSGELQGFYDAVKPFPFSSCVIKGEDYPVFEIGEYKFAIASCYEECYANIFAKYKDKDVDFFVTLSNDASMGSLGGLKIKSHQTKLRAAETGKYVVSATNTGLTQVVNPYGKVVSVLEPNVRGYLLTDIYLKN